MFEIGTDEQVDNTYGWCREGVTLQKDILQGVPLSSIDWWMLVFSRDEVILIRDLDDIRLQYPMVYAMLKPQDVTTLAAGPVTSEGKVIGFLGVDNPNREMMGMLAPIINVSGRFVDACHEMGIGIALDDFGSGYSSLRMLLQYPSSIIKLDRSLLLEMAASEDKMNSLSSIVYACHRFGKKVCMEGVETPAQNRMIRESGCDMIQGFYYYRPMELEDVCRLISGGAGEAPATNEKEEP